MIANNSVSSDRFAHALMPLPAAAEPAFAHSFAFSNLLADAPVAPPTPQFNRADHDHLPPGGALPTAPEAPARHQQPLRSHGESEPVCAAQTIESENVGVRERRRRQAEANDDHAAATADARDTDADAQLKLIEPVVGVDIAAEAACELEAARQQAADELCRLLVGAIVGAAKKTAGKAVEADAAAAAKNDVVAAAAAKIADADSSEKALAANDTAGIAKKIAHLNELLEKAVPDAAQRQNLRQVLEQALNQARLESNPRQAGNEIADFLEKASGVRIHSLHGRGATSVPLDKRLEKALQQLLTDAAKQPSARSQQLGNAQRQAGEAAFAMRLRRLLGQHRPGQGTEPALNLERKDHNSTPVKTAAAFTPESKLPTMGKADGGGLNNRGGDSPTGREGLASAMANLVAGNSISTPTLTSAGAMPTAFSTPAAREIFDHFQQMLGRGANDTGSQLALRFQSNSLGNVDMAAKDQNGTLTLALQVADEAARNRVLNCRDELISQLRAMGYTQVNVQVGGGNAGLLHDQADTPSRHNGNDIAANVRLAGSDNPDSFARSALEKLLVSA